MKQASPNGLPGGRKDGCERVTIRDVARAAGVSPGTVSHVLNGTAPISEATKARVRKVIAELDYTRNENARALRTSDSRIIGVVLQDISSAYYAQCTASILRQAQEMNFAVLISNADFSPTILKTGIAALINRRVKGLIFVGGYHDPEFCRMAEDAGIPIVFGDCFVENYPCVQFNNRETMFRMTQALYEQGYREFCYVGENTDAQENLEQRYGGVCDALKALGVPEENFDAVLDPGMRRDKTRLPYDIFMQHPEYAAGKGGKRAILTSNDLIAQSIISACRRLEMRVPEDVAVIGFDDISIASYSIPSITTVSQDPALLGEKCFKTLMDRLDHPDEPVRTLTLEQQIVVRESAPLNPQPGPQAAHTLANTEI